MATRALVTGANRGIGKAVARSLAAIPDIELLAAARREEDAVAAARELGARATGVALDLADPREVTSRAERLLAQHGPVDILVNNAGVLLPGDAISASLADIEASLAINATSPLALIRVLGPAMKARGSGRIVNISSAWGSFDEGLSGPAAYSISKATLNAVTLSAAQALGRTVKVNAMCPGWVRSRMGGQAAPRSPEEAADTAVWLATLPDDGPTGGFWRDRHLIEW